MFSKFEETEYGLVEPSNLGVGCSGCIESPDSTGFLVACSKSHAKRRDNPTAFRRVRVRGWSPPQVLSDRLDPMGCCGAFALDVVGLPRLRKPKIRDEV